MQLNTKIQVYHTVVHLDLSWEACLGKVDVALLSS